MNDAINAGTHTDPHPHWNPSDGSDRHPQTLDEWDCSKDPVGEHLKRAVRRLNMAIDRDDPRAPDQMAMVLRWDLASLMHDWIHKNAYFEMMREKRESALSTATVEREAIARIIDPKAMDAGTNLGQILLTADLMRRQNEALAKADAILARLDEANSWCSDMSLAPKDREIMIAGGLWYSTADDWKTEYPHEGWSLASWHDHAWRGERDEQYDTYYFYEPTHWRFKIALPAASAIRGGKQP